MGGSEESVSRMPLLLSTTDACRKGIPGEKDCKNRAKQMAFAHLKACIGVIWTKPLQEPPRSMSDAFEIDLPPKNQLWIYTSSSDERH